MYFQEDNFEHKMDQREKLTSGVSSSILRQKLIRNWVVLTRIIVISIVIGTGWSLFMYRNDGPVNDLIGTVITLSCCLVFDCFMGWIIFVPHKETNIYRLNLRLIVAVISILIISIFFYTLWASYNPISYLFFSCLLLGCINLILNMILNRRRDVPIYQQRNGRY